MSGMDDVIKELRALRSDVSRLERERDELAARLKHLEDELVRWSTKTANIPESEKERAIAEFGARLSGWILDSRARRGLGAPTREAG